MISFLVFVILIIVFFGAMWWEKKNNPIRVFPFPYTFHHELKSTKDFTPNQEEFTIGVIGQNSDFHEGMDLENLKKSLEEKVKHPVKFIFLGKPTDHLPRVLNLLRSMKNLPKYILWWGPLNEFKEQKFFENHIPAIESNILRYKNDLLLTFIMAIPEISKYVYSFDGQYSFSSKPRPINKMNHVQKILYKELNYTLIGFEIDEILQILEKHQSEIIAITPPLKIGHGPFEVCEASQFPTLTDELQEVQKNMNEGAYKSVILALKPFIEKIRGNAMLHHTFGTALLNSGEIQEGVQHLLLAQSFDCGIFDPQYFDPLSIEIFKKKFLSLQRPLIALDDWSKVQLTHKTFFDGQGGIDIFYKDKLYKDIVEEIARLYEIKPLEKNH